MGTRKKDFAPAVTREQFDAMTPSQQRVAIMEDVLAQLKAGRLVPTRQVWAASARDAVLAYEKIHFEREALIASDTPTCYACAIGSAFCSAIRLGNACDVRTSAVSMGDMADVLNRYFVPRQRLAMEFAFEGGGGATDVDDMSVQWTADEILWFKRFARRHRSSSARLRAIALNIIANNGSFTPDLPLTT